MDHRFVALVLAAVLLHLMFLLSGVHKARTFDATVASLQSRAPWVPLPKVAIGLVIALEVLAPLVVLAAYVAPLEDNAKDASTKRMLQEAARIAIVLLLVFTAVVTLLYHPLRMDQSYMKNLPFFSNVSLVGGLLSHLLLLQK